MPLLLENLTELKSDQARELISHGQFVGLDPLSIRQLIFRHPLAFLNALSQKLSDLILFPLRAGWSELTIQQRNRFPWLGAALEWGVTSAELYTNAQGLPSRHPLQKPAIAAAYEMATWEQSHPFLSWIARDSRALDRLVGQPVPIGSDGWPLSQLDPQGNDLPLEKIYSDVHLLYHRQRPEVPKGLQKTIQKTASQALRQGRLAIIQAK